MVCAGDSEALSTALHTLDHCRFSKGSDSPDWLPVRGRRLLGPLVSVFPNRWLLGDGC